MHQDDGIAVVSIVTVGSIRAGGGGVGGPGQPVALGGHHVGGHRERVGECRAGSE